MIDPGGTFRSTIRRCRFALVGVGLISIVLNLLLLAVPLYSLQVFDRVLTSRSTETLILLSVIAVTAIVVLAGLDGARSRILAGIGVWIDERLARPLLASAVAAMGQQQPLRAPVGLRELAQLRGFLTGPGLVPLLDAPWIPIFVAVVWLIHPWLGALTGAGALILLVCAVISELGTRKLAQEANRAVERSAAEADAALRNAEAIEAMGMLPGVLRRWDGRAEEARTAGRRAAVRAGSLSAFAKFIRLTLQIGVYGVAGYLAIRHEITPGAMIASAIIASRALAPVEQAIAGWRTMAVARDAYGIIRARLVAAKPRGQNMALPQPAGRLQLEEVGLALPGASTLFLRQINLTLAPGETLVVIGPSAAGKTTLARLMVGVLAPSVGHVRLDGVDVARWDPDERGRWIGYMPQDSALFSASVRDNIARFTDAPAEDVVAAAKLAGIHDLVLALPQGYDTLIGEGGVPLSAGQRQRVGLARAVFAAPAFVVLDEPNANLDAAGEAALVATIKALKERGTTVVIIAHRASVISHADRVLVLRNGTVEALGPRDQVLARIARPVPIERERA